MMIVINIYLILILIVQMSECVKVMVRARPTNQREINEGIIINIIFYFTLIREQTMCNY